MPLPVSEIARELTHTRCVRFEGYKRADGDWDIEAHLVDVKSHDYPLKTGVRRAGQPVHEMWLRLTFDTGFNVRDAIAVSDAYPYPGGCESFGDVYRGLIGLNLLQGFNRQVRERLGGVRGCTHLTEMLGFFPTAAIQTLAGEMKEERDDGAKPFQIDACHALASRGETVRRLYPKWYTAGNKASA